MSIGGGYREWWLQPDLFRWTLLEDTGSGDYNRTYLDEHCWRIQGVVTATGPVWMSIVGGYREWWLQLDLFGWASFGRYREWWLQLNLSGWALFEGTGSCDCNRTCLDDWISTIEGYWWVWKKGILNLSLKRRFNPQTWQRSLMFQNISTLFEGFKSLTWNNALASSFSLQ